MFMFIVYNSEVLYSIIIHLVKFKCWRRVALHEHVTAGGLVWNVENLKIKLKLVSIPTFHRSIFLLDLDNPGRSGLSDGLQRDGGFVQPPLPLGLLVPGRVLAAAPSLQGREELELSWRGGERERETLPVMAGYSSESVNFPNVPPIIDILGG